MMKIFCLGILLALLACNDQVSPVKKANLADSLTRNADDKPHLTTSPDTTSPAPAREYANTRFKSVTVKKVGEDSFNIKGKGQIFEASFGWVVEDGHDELKKGYQMTDAGAPEWGQFNFTVEVPKKRPNSSRTLILFETSAKDGSRQHELPIVLD